MLTSKNVFKNNLLKNQVCVVSGGRTGIGLAIVNKFLEHGAKIAVLGRKKEALVEAFNDGRKGGRLYLFECDIRNPDQVRLTVNSIILKLKKIDILINNAAINFMIPAEKLMPNMIDLSIDTNLKGHLLLTNQIGRQMIKQPGYKRIINISAYAGGKAYPGFSHFHACKAGLDALTRTLSIEWSKYKILVNSVSPGPVLTDNFINAYSRLFKLRKQNNNKLLKMDGKLPLRNFIPIDEVASLLLYLSSDSLRNITGQTIAIDGGVGIINEYFQNMLEN